MPYIYFIDTDLPLDTINWNWQQGAYLNLGECLELIPNNGPLKKLFLDHADRIAGSRGSSHNHQAWDGGYIDHVVETMNIACQQYNWMSRSRPMPFTLGDALLVMFLHDIEKPWKHGKPEIEMTKQERKDFRSKMIAEYGIELTDEHRNALKYVEGVPDSEYTPGERTMGRLAAFCHCCDILSARLWHDEGRKGW
jgi:hypothetical protein